MDPLIIFVARYLIIALPIALLQQIWMLPSKEKFRFVALTLISLALAYSLAKAGTHLYDNPRPFVVGAFEPLIPHGIENGFPSLHTLFAATIAMLVFTKHRILGGLMFACAVCIGVARIAAGVHHGVDVFAGLCIGVFAVYAAGQLLRIRVYR